MWLVVSQHYAPVGARRSHQRCAACELGTALSLLPPATSPMNHGGSWTMVHVGFPWDSFISCAYFGSPLLWVYPACVVL